MTLETPFPVKKQANTIYIRNKVSSVSVFPNRSLGTRPWEQAIPPLVPKLRFGNGMTLETLFPVKKQTNRIYTRNKVSGVSVFPNRSLGTRPQSFDCHCVPKLEFGNKTSPNSFPNLSLGTRKKGCVYLTGKVVTPDFEFFVKGFVSEYLWTKVKTKFFHFSKNIVIFHIKINLS